MKYCKTLKGAGKLAKKTDLQAVTRNQTRWSSTYTMLKRFFEIEPHLQQDDPNVEDLLPNTRDRNKLVDLNARMREFDEVTKMLQCEKLNLSDVRHCFDHMMKKYPDMNRWLAANADIVKSPVFECAIVKVIDGQSDSLTAEERDALAPFTAMQAPTMASDDENASISQVMARKRARTAGNTYRNVSHIPPTSNACERLFSRARRLSTDYRKSMHPKTGEALLFLDLNATYWSAQLVNDIVTKNPIAE